MPQSQHGRFFECNKLSRPTQGGVGMKDCSMCGRQTKTLVNRWYKYDNGERFITWVCIPCADLHAKLVSA